MKTRKKAWLALAALAGLLGTGTAQVTNPAYLNIDVTIMANLSVAVNGQQSSTHDVTWNTMTSNAKLVSAATATVTNDSGGQTEKWALSTNANSINTAGGSDYWTLDTTTDTLPGDDFFALQAVFGSSNTLASACPGATSGDWDQDFATEITSSLQNYTSARFSDTSLSNDGSPKPDLITGNADGRMFNASKRALCWRVIRPLSTQTADQQNIQLIITARNP